MQRSLRQFILSASFLALAASAAAQGRVPAAESGAIGADVGVIATRSDAFDSGLVLEGFYEYYFTARVSMRLGLGWANAPREGEDEDSIRTLRVPFDIVYNWEQGQMHPFVGSGIGIYFLQPRDNGESSGDSETKLGATIFGGAEFFTGRTLSIKGEARYHIVGETFGVDQGGLAVTIGLKTYF